MPPAPPPPPPANLPNFSTVTAKSKPTGLPNTSALLKSIEKGTKLKKTVTNDRSAPLISNQKNSAAPNKSSQASTASSSTNDSATSAGLGGLFANGFPTLRSTKQTSEKTDRPLPKPMTGSIPDVMKNPAKNIARSATESIFHDPEKALNIAKKGSQVVAPVLISEANKQLEKAQISVDIPNSTRQVQTGKKIDTLSPKSSNKGKQERWHFTIERDDNLPAPRKYRGFKKHYISETINSSEKHSKLTAGDEVTESDIKGFIKTLKSKIDKAASKEEFEECIRLKSKLKSFEAIEKRIKAGEQISATELPV